MKRNILLAIALVVLAFTVGFTFQRSQTQWEYKVESGISEKNFNNLGSQGWEIVSCGSFNGGMPYCVFKRAKQQP